MSARTVGKVSITLEGSKIETGPQPSPVICVGIIGGVRCDPGALAAYASEN